MKQIKLVKNLFGHFFIGIKQALKNQWAPESMGIILTWIVHADSTDWIKNKKSQQFLTIMIING